LNEEGNAPHKTQEGLAWETQRAAAGMERCGATNAGVTFGIHKHASTAALGKWRDVNTAVHLKPVKTEILERIMLLLLLLAACTEWNDKQRDSQDGWGENGNCIMRC
jgi:hypothetical protein